MKTSSGYTHRPENSKKWLPVPSVTKLLRKKFSETFFVIFDGFCTFPDLQEGQTFSWKITHEVRNLAKYHILESFFTSSNFVSEGTGAKFCWSVCPSVLDWYFLRVWVHLTSRERPPTSKSYEDAIAGQRHFWKPGHACRFSLWN